MHDGSVADKTEDSDIAIAEATEEASQFISEDATRIAVEEAKTVYR
jgi:hypothetical protein